MSCGDYEHLVALYVEEDLSAAERGRVKAHLQECSDCWDLAEDLRQSQAVFKSIRQDVPDATALAALRGRVLNEVGSREAMTWFERVFLGGLRRKAAMAGIAIVVLGSGLVWVARSPRNENVAPPAITVAREPAVVVPLPVSDPEPVDASRPPAPRRVSPPVPPAEETATQVAIKFVTDDPNVIIYWLVDEKGE